MSRQLRPAPAPLEANDRLVAAVLTAAWAVALVVVAALWASLPAADRWWLWTCVAGFVMGLFGLWYVPRLQRSRAHAAERRAAAQGEGRDQEVAGPPA
jgi:hypothetical protein